MKQNIIQKIWNLHVVASEKNSPDVLFIDLQLLHEVTSPQAFSLLRKRGKPVFDPTRNIATIDHSLPTDQKRIRFADVKNKHQIDTFRKNCTEHNIPLFDIESGNQGIVHVMGPELGLTQPGMTIVCGDSHTSTHGAFGALAFGIGTTQISHVLETSCLLLEQPKTMKISFIGTPSEYFTAKDAILLLIRTIGVQGGTGHVLEYTGEYISGLSLEERMTICNMSIECGARAGLIAPDTKTFEFLKNTPYGKQDSKQREEYWKTFVSDEGSSYDAEVIIDLQNALPVVTWGTTPAQSIQIDECIPEQNTLPGDQAVLAKKSLSYVQLAFGQSLEGVAIQNVFLGSCTNGRLSDLRESAKILSGKKVASGVRMMVVPGSEQVEKQAKAEGLDRVFLEAGAEFRRPGCSACLAMNGDSVPAGERCASTSNRNFIGRQGVGSFTHLMSPQMATICGILGHIPSVREMKELF